MDRDSSHHPVFVGDWLVEPQLNSLRRGDLEARVEPRSMDVLMVLVRHPEEVLSKGTLLRAVWGDQVVSEEALTHAVWELRKTLGDNARKPSYIQTIPKRGYRLISPVRMPEEPETPDDGEALRSSTDSASGSSEAAPEQRVSDGGEAAATGRAGSGARGLGRWFLPVVGLSLLALFLSSMARFSDRPTEPEPAPRPSGEPILIRATVGACSTRCGEAERIASGLEGELGHRLGGLPGFPLISGSTARLHRQAPVAEIAAVAPYLVDLSVSEVAESSKLRIDLELVSAREDRSMWRRRVDVAGPPELAGRPSELAAGVARSLLAERPQLDVELADFEVFLTLLDAADVPWNGGPPASASNAADSAYQQALLNARLENFERSRLQKALELFDFAVQQDPSFHQAWIWIAKIRSKLSFNGHADQRLLKSVTAAIEQARSHGAEPDQVEMARAYFAYYGERDYGRALELLLPMAERRPRDVEVMGMLAFLHRRLGRLEEAVGWLRGILALEPENGAITAVLAETLRAQRRFEEASKLYGRAVELDPSNVTTRGEAALTRFAATGSVAAAKDILAHHPHASDPELLYYSMPLLLYERQFQTAALRYSQSAPTSNAIFRFQSSWHLVLALQSLGRDEEARVQAEEIRRFVEEQVRSKPGFNFYRGYLALIHAFLGHDEEARREIGRALELSTNDAFSGPRIRQMEAQVLALLGDLGPSFEILRQLLAMEYQHCVTHHELRADPFWDPWRGHASFPAPVEESR